MPVCSCVAHAASIGLVPMPVCSCVARAASIGLVPMPVCSCVARAASIGLVPMPFCSCVARAASIGLVPMPFCSCVARAASIGLVPMPFCACVARSSFVARSSGAPFPVPTSHPSSFPLSFMQIPVSFLPTHASTPCLISPTPGASAADSVGAGAAAALPHALQHAIRHPSPPAQARVRQRRARVPQSQVHLAHWPCEFQTDEYASQLSHVSLRTMHMRLTPHLRKHEYNSAVHEYLKAKSISLTGHVENAIRLLLEIDPDSDPVWQYVGMRERRIRGLLEACVQQHERRVQGIRRRRQEKREEEHQWRLLQRNPHEKLEPGLAAFLNGEVEEQEEAEDVLDGEEEEEVQQQHALLVCRLAAVLQQQLPQLWKVMLGIFTGKFANFSKETPAAAAYPYAGAYGAKPPLPRSNSGLSNQGGRGAGAGGPYRKHTQMEGVAMVMGIVGVFEGHVTDAFTALESSRELRPHMLQAVSAVAQASSAFAAAEAAPPLAVQALHQCRITITARFVRQLCFIMRGAAGDVARQEEWVPAPAHLTKGSEFDISHFPVRFGDTVGAALDQITQALAQLSKDGPSIPVASGSDAAAAQAVAAAEVWRMYASVKTTFYESFVDAC
ncbi:unnamed protein product, partial [Closterium sp. NIES-54]